MSSIDELFLMRRPGSDPATDRQAWGTSLLVWVPDADVAAAVVAEHAEEARLVELYGGFELAEAAQVIEAAAGRVPVGVAGAGTAAVRSVRRSAVIYLEQAEPIVHAHADGGVTTVLFAPDPEAAVSAARLAVDQGAELVEMCGGTPLTHAAQVAMALAGRVPVTLVAWPFESIDGAASYKSAFEAATSGAASGAADS